jgi:hypothetical protein
MYVREIEREFIQVEIDDFSYETGHFTRNGGGYYNITLEYFFDYEELVDFIEANFSIENIKEYVLSTLKMLKRYNFISELSFEPKNGKALIYASIDPED